MSTSIPDIMDALSGDQYRLSSTCPCHWSPVEIAAPSQGIPTSRPVLSNAMLSKDLNQTPSTPDMDSNPAIHPHKIHCHPCYLGSLSPHRLCVRIEQCRTWQLAKTTTPPSLFRNAV